MDPFEILSLPRRPFLDDEEIATAYRKLAGELHPDQQGGDASAFRELGEAAAILRDPARRLRSLDGMEAGSIPPPEAADLFPQVANLLREADDLLARHTTATNPLAKAVLATPLKKLATNLDTLLATIGNWRFDLDTRLVALDDDWPAHEPNEVSSLADSFAYADRWASQLRERKLALDCD